MIFLCTATNRCKKCTDMMEVQLPTLAGYSFSRLSNKETHRCENKVLRNSFRQELINKTPSEERLPCQPAPHSALPHTLAALLTSPIQCGCNVHRNHSLQPVRRSRSDIYICPILPAVFTQNPCAQTHIDAGSLRLLLCLGSRSRSLKQQNLD